MSWGWKPYVPVAQRRANALKKLTKIAKAGAKLLPVHIQGKKIASTFWGEAWCDNLESYSDFSNRLPRGRTYVRNGSVMDLQISEGKVTAVVSGSELYKIEIKIKPLAKSLWGRIQTECAGKIDSLMELLQGKISAGVMQMVTHKEKGLFPKPSEISMSCSCPDWAGMCKHVAASLYGVGARLDESPDLLFLLRGVNPGDLINQASAASVVQQAASVAQPVIGDLADVFGIDIDSSPSPSAPASASPVNRTAKPHVEKSSKAKPKVSSTPKAQANVKVKTRKKVALKKKLEAQPKVVKVKFHGR